MRSKTTLSAWRALTWGRRAGNHLALRGLLLPLICGFIALLLVLAFVSLASEVREGDTHGIDLYLLQQAQALRAAHPAVAVALRDISALGGTTVLTLLVVLATGYLVLVRARASAALVVASVLAGTAMLSLLKQGFGRPRPDRAMADMVAQGMSFPSGHASMSALVYVTAGALIAASRPAWQERLYILGASAGVAALVGLSRIGLGVHWATDVLAGWAFGTAWAVAWLLLDWWLRNRGAQARR